MSSGSFFSSLIGSYSGLMIQKHREERDREERGKEAELRVLQAAAGTGELGPDEMRATFERMEEITNEIAGGKGKKKGGFSFGNLIGKFSDTGGQTKAGASGGTNGGPPQQASSGAAGTSAPPSRPMSEETPIGGSSTQIPKVSMGNPPVRPGTTQPTTQGVNIQNPPTRGSKFNFQDPTDIVTKQEIAKTKARLSVENDDFKAKLKEATDSFVKAHAADHEGKGPTQREVYDNVEATMRGLKGDDTALIREQMKEDFQTVRDKNNHAFTLEMEKMKEKAKEQSDNRHDELLMRMMGARMSFQDQERMKITPAQMNAEINSSLTSMRQQLNQSSKELAAAKAAAQKRSGSLWQKMIADVPDVAGAEQDVQNRQAAIAHIEKYRTAVIKGKKDLSDVIDEAEAIALGGASTVPAGMEPGETIDLRTPSGK